MAVQQRIIGGGLLLAGIAVVLILIFLFTNKGVPWDEAYDQFRKDIHPRYVKAEEEGDYLALQRIAEDALKIEKGTAMPSVLQEIKAEAAKGNGQAQALQKLFESDAFTKNAQGLYAIDGGWYESRPHSALRLLKRSLGEALPALLDARRTAKTATTVLADLRLGSGLELPPPPAAPAADAVALADGALFAVFGLRAEDVTKALASKGESAKAKSARLVWNQSDASGTRARLAQEMAKIPALAETIERAAVALGKSEKDLRDLDAAKKQGAAYVKTAAAQLAAGLESAARPAFEAEATIASIAGTLMQEAKTLKAYASGTASLGQALTGGFAP
jgi:hypothetical protein